MQLGWISEIQTHYLHSSPTTCESLYL